MFCLVKSTVDKKMCDLCQLNLFPKTFFKNPEFNKNSNISVDLKWNFTSAVE